MDGKQIGCSAIIAMLCALTTMVFLLTARIETILGTYPVQLLGLACVLVSLSQSRRWWMLVAALILAVPLVIWAILIFGFFS
jgi:hypothetical protein